ncbi:MAG TPA: histidine--tRNA ligase [Candidatus Dormibacteraeota bacterium]|nr:histidine--tRNA ligase [Candidatus Dormibacteraeota bacterium]
MALSTQPYKGARDFYPEDKRLQKYIFSNLRRVVEQFGYQEYDAPILEPLELYLAKTGEEIVNEQTYSFTDRGGRQVVIRPEMTPTVSRMVAARRQQLAYPLRWYSIPNLWRYERPQKGRLREHWQLNVDIFGISSLEAEVETISLMSQILNSFGAQPKMYRIRLNSRKLMDSILRDYLKLGSDEAKKIAQLIDRMHKLERTEFISQADSLLSAESKQNGATEKLLDVLGAKDFRDLPKLLSTHASAIQLEQLIDRLKKAGIKNAQFDPSLMRGFDYYTDIVFEIFDTHPDNNRSLFGGGRYDGLVGLFGVDPIPTVGFGMGDVTLSNFLEGHHLLPQLSSETDIWVALIGPVYDKCSSLLTGLRRQGLNLAVDFSGRKLGDQLKAAQKNGLMNVLIIGEKELTEDLFTLKDLSSGSEQKVSSSELSELLIKQHRKKQDDSH